MGSLGIETLDAHLEGELGTQEMTILRGVSISVRISYGGAFQREMVVSVWGGPL